MFSVHYIEQIFTEYISRNSICKRLTLHCISLIQIVPYNATQPLLSPSQSITDVSKRRDGRKWSVWDFFNLGKKEKSRAYSKRIAGFLSIGLVLWGQSIPSTNGTSPSCSTPKGGVYYVTCMNLTTLQSQHLIPQKISHMFCMWQFTCKTLWKHPKATAPAPHFSLPPVLLTHLKNIALKQWTTWSKS